MRIAGASAWEIATKYRIGKLPEAKTLVATYPETLKRANFEELAITAKHALQHRLLPNPRAKTAPPPPQVQAYPKQPFRHRQRKE